MPKICYFCDSPSTSREHVPPQCIFPEQKDVPDGANFRKNLITVPSCDAHNSEKSEDDTYLMMVLVSYFQNNEAAHNQIISKVVRAWTKDRTLAKTVVKNLQQVKVAGKLHHAYEIDTDRFNRSLELIAHGLHFHTFKSRATYPYRAISYPLAQLEGAHANDVNIGRAKILAMADQMLSGLPALGQNKEIFWYQLSPEVNASHVLRMCFFGAFVVVAMCSPTTGA
jgi:hypothetical protein